MSATFGGPVVTYFNDPRVEELENEVTRLKRGEFTSEELEQFSTARTDSEVLESLLAELGISYFTEGPLHRFTFETVTVFRQDGKEACCVDRGDDEWQAVYKDENTTLRQFRVNAEAWCLKQLRPPKPKWRQAKTDGSDFGKICRAKLHHESEWDPGMLICHDPKLYAGPWIIRLDDGGALIRSICQVQDE